MDGLMQDCGSGQEASGSYAARSPIEERLTRLVAALPIKLFAKPRRQVRAATPPPAAVPCPEDTQLVVDFSRILLSEGIAEAVLFVRAVRDTGVSMETAFLDLFSPAARRLGVLWETDICSFAQVTIALGRMQIVLHEVSPAFQEEPCIASCRGRRALLAAAPSEQHTFGLTMLAEFLMRDGWDVATEPKSSEAGLAKAVQGRWIDLVGLTASCDGQLDRVNCIIKVMRRVSRNRAVVVLVGGKAFLDHPERVARVGADATARNGHEACVLAARLCDSARTCQAASRGV